MASARGSSVLTPSSGSCGSGLFLPVRVPSLCISTDRPAGPGPGAGAGSPHLRGGQGRGPGRGRRPRAGAKTPAALPQPALGPVQAEPVPRGPGRPQRCHRLEPGGLAEPSAPLWPGDKASSKFSPWSKPRRFTGTAGPAAGLPVTSGEGGGPARRLLPCPRSERTPAPGNRSSPPFPSFTAPLEPGLETEEEETQALLPSLRRGWGQGRREEGGGDGEGRMGREQGRERRIQGEGGGRGGWEGEKEAA